MKIFINPGHMIGVDSGAVSEEYGITEAEVNYSVAALLKQHLISEGLDVKLLQSANLCGENPRYTEVCRSANEWRADLFVSLHCNSFAREAARGAETWCYAPNSKGEVAAEDIQKAIIEDFPELVDRGVKYNKEFMVLKHTAMPAVLVEMGFISNSKDVKILMHKQSGLAKAIGKGIILYLTGR